MFFDDSARVLAASAGHDDQRDALALKREVVDLPASLLLSRAQEINASHLKRVIDLCGACALLLIFLPAMFLIALAIRLESKGPVLFRQQRFGVGRSVFMLLKFRSMTVMETEGAFRQVTVGDARITRVGCVLRRTSLDELPQLVNVLLGHMSLVGPRPHAVPMDEAYARMIPNYCDRHLVRPGITGLAQIEGFRGPTDGMEKIQSRLRCDRDYIRRWTPAFDIKILLQTPMRLLASNAF